MVAVTSGTLLITGGTGYVGAWVVKEAVEGGFTVVAAVRKEADGEFLKKANPSYADKISHVIVSDITVDGAYDEAVKGVDGIIHIASPAVFTTGEPSLVIEPAVKGTTGILKSAAKTGKDVKRVVITSSVGALTFAAFEKAPVTLDETAWGNAVVEYVNKNGVAAHPATKYTASKTLAEQAAWKFMEEEKPSYELTTVLPSYVTGPWRHNVDSQDKVQSTIGIYNGLFKAPPADPSVSLGSFVDSRDVGVFHLLALTTPAAGGERVIVSGTHYSPQDVYDALNNAQPAITHDSIPKGNPGVSKPHNVTYNTEKGLKLFPSFKYRTVAESVPDMTRQLIEGDFFAK